MAELNYLSQVPLGGFNFDQCLRNKALESSTNSTHKSTYTKTGTTICGALFNVSRFAGSLSLPPHRVLPEAHTDFLFFL